MKIKNNSILKNIAGEYVILPLNSYAVSLDVILKTNEVGAFIYNALKNDLTYDELFKLVYDEFEVDTKTLDKDLQDFITSLRKKGLLDD